MKQRHLSIWIVGVTGFLVAFLVCSHMCSVQSHAVTQITDLSARSEDGAIVLNWTPLTNHQENEIEITIQNDEETQLVEVPASDDSYTYTEGEHGALYGFSVKVSGSQESQTARAMFLDYQQLPNLPIITIETVTGQDPTCEIAISPPLCWGSTAVENDYLNMTIQVAKKNHVLVNATGRIRVRGNGSASFKQKPYKIKLDQGMDLLSIENGANKDTDWLLIRYGTQFKTEIGHYVADLIGSEWQPRYCPVNVMLNGDWKGCYLLIESVKRSPNRVNIDDDGFLIENDAYWWDTDGQYFRTTYQNQQMGYTFQYPEITKIESPRAVEIKQYMIDYEKALIEGTGDYTDYIDVNSFSCWLLTHDILKNMDGSGSNIYLYKNDMNLASKLKLGPAWDFDGTMPEDAEDWSVIHWIWIMHFDKLLQKEEFRTAYLQKWDEVSDTFCADVQTFLNEYTEQYGDALQESWDLDSERWQTDSANIQESVDFVNTWFAERKAWLDTAMQGI